MKKRILLEKNVMHIRNSISLKWFWLTILGHNGRVSAFVDNEIVAMCGTIYQKTVRTGDCDILCPPLLSTCSNNCARYLNTPEKLTKIHSLRKRAKNAESQNTKLRETLLRSRLMMTLMLICWV